jgi:NADPH2:quinone reductase
MKSIVMEKLGGPEVLQVKDVPIPAAGPRQVLVRQKAVGVNFIDIYRRSGLYPMTLPTVPGTEGAGIVEAVGAEVRGIAAGDRVAYVDALGAYAEAAVVPAERVVRIPDPMGFEEAAAAMLQGMTAHYLALDAYGIKKGDTVLVHAGAGGVGLLLVQIARMRGARVLATVSTQEKADLARGAGAEETILYTREDFVPAVKRITGGRGVQAVYDSVGKDTFLGSLDCLAPRGVMVSFGQSSGKVAAIEPSILSAKGSLFLTRPTLGHYIADAMELERRAGEVFNWIAKGSLRLRIGARFPLAQAAEAHRLLESRATSGKVLLIP